MSKVWVVNFAGHDYSDAERYGDLEFITHGHIERDHFDRMLYIVAESLKDSSPDDWLLPSGLLPLNVLATAVWLEMHDSLRLLIWDFKKKGYRTMTVEETHIPSLLRNLDRVSESA